MALEDIVSKFVLKRDLDARDTYINFEVCAVDDEDEDVDLPYMFVTTVVPNEWPLIEL